ncbi:cupin [Planomonospora sphaerica]|uniref:Cupin n=1 Tax=Planomonospora sphaerica TaxID=161355 RepID=A0A171DMX5_9ACTN|nr:cupin domain-containing protein [Planomonospora sphaerica]GAT70392.1 cupin [Planomonospora sphaerica]
MPVIRAAEARRSATPNAVMTTFASPTLGGAGQVLWRVDMAPGKEGPLHAFEAEQIWTLLEGGATVDLAGEKIDLAAGDTVVMPADLPRQVFADARSGFTAIVTAPVGGRVYNPGGVSPEGVCELAPKDAERITPPWIA